MNFAQHIAVGVGTAGVGVFAGIVMGFVHPDYMTLGLVAVIVAAGAIAVDLAPHNLS